MSVTGTFSVALNDTNVAYNQTINVNGTSVAVNVPAGPYLRVVARGNTTDSDSTNDHSTLIILGITLTGDLEARYRAEAQREGVAVEALATRRLEEVELLQRIFHSFPPDETREFRSLVAKRGAGTLTEAEQVRLTALAHRREEYNAQRFAHILALAKLRGVRYRSVMAELGIRPARIV